MVFQTNGSVPAVVLSVPQYSVPLDAIAFTSQFAAARAVFFIIEVWMPPVNVLVAVVVAVIYPTVGLEVAPTVVPFIQ